MNSKPFLLPRKKPFLCPFPKSNDTLIHPNEQIRCPKHSRIVQYHERSITPQIITKQVSSDWIDDVRPEGPDNGEVHDIDAER